MDRDSANYSQAIRHVQCEGDLFAFTFNVNFWGDKEPMLSAIQDLDENFLTYIGPIYKERAQQKQKTKFRYQPCRIFANLLVRGHPEGPRDPVTLAYQFIEFEYEKKFTRISFEIVGDISDISDLQ